MRVRAVVSETGLGAAENDDRAGWAEAPTGLFAWVMDGATNVAEQDFLGAEQGDVAWYSQALSAALSVRAREALSPRGLHEAAANDVSAAYAELLARLPNRPPLHAQPMAALVLARIVGAELELYELGDCAVFALADDGAVQRLTAAEEKSHVVEAGANIAARQAIVGVSAKAVWQDRLSSLQRERDVQLTRPVLGVSTPVAGVRFGGRETRHDLTGVRSLVLMSDGFERYAAKYGLGDDAAMVRRTVGEGPERLLTDIRALEVGDPECRRIPRLKPSDDATCLVLGR